MSKEHILIVGQGLAGTILSFEFTQRRISHMVIDNNHESAATLAAAGIINPITGRRYVKSWMIDDLLSVAQQMYISLEKLLDVKLITAHNILRSFESNAEENRWTESTSRPGYKDYVVEASLGGYASLLRQTKRYGEITQAFKVDVPLLVKSYRKYLLEHNQLIEDQFDFHLIKNQSTISFGEETFTKVVDCTGYKSAIDSPFSYLPYQPAKGESFEVVIDEVLPTEKLLRDKIFIAPIDRHSFWTGGGYEWDSSNNLPTIKFKQLWTQKLNTLLSVPYKVISHLSGIRPSVKGRRPLLGQHPTFEILFLFNGMGTKGTSLAPYWSQKMADLLIDQVALSSDVDLSRFELTPGL